MHELSVASSIIKSVTAEISQRNLRSVVKIGIKIGALTDIVPDALIFGFDSLKKDTVLKSATLEIEKVPIVGKCDKCQKEFEVKEFIFICPDCGSVVISTAQGKELDITFLETGE